MVHNTLWVHKIASFSCLSAVHMPCTLLSRARLLLRRARLDCACALLCPPLCFSHLISNPTSTMILPKIIQVGPQEALDRYGC